MSLNKKDSITIIFIISSFLLYKIFPTSGSFQDILLIVIIFIVFPILFEKCILKNKNKEAIFCISDWKKGLIFSGLSLLFSVLVFVFLVVFFGFFDKYTILKVVGGGFAEFIVYELMVVVFFVGICEFYFRKFILNAFRKRIGSRSIFVQTLFFYTLFLMINNRAFYLFLPYLIFAPLAGLIYYKSNSLLYSFMSQFLLIFFLDLISIKINS
ncbi:MAG: hypothetical protein ACD_9C00021G0003 [uncultured bacterium]|nr:MAG: hypothetical protein ACD_9C00021G0003 [uncultured bacterium]